MSEPTWELLGGGGVVGGPIDYVGDWAAGTQYQPGQVVRYGGIDYLAVNPSLGQVPPASTSLIPTIGTSLPASPVDGQEAILVDSVTVPTYAWRFRYVASITDAYKWVFVGGSELAVFSGTTSPAFAAPPTWNQVVGPDVIIPRSGIYRAGAVCQLGVSVANQQAFIGICNASISTDPVPGQSGVYVSNYDTGVINTLVTAAAGQTLRITVQGGNMNAYARTLTLLPKRVA